MRQIKSTDLDYRVTFIGTYMTLTTTVYAHDEDDAIEEAQNLIHEQYGYRPEMWANDIESERIEP